MAITGKITRDGTITITWNIEAERLIVKPGETQYLPCCTCGVVYEVPLSYISFLCNPCDEARKRGD